MCRLGFFLVLLVLVVPFTWAQSVDRGPYLQTQTDNSVIVRWRTNTPTDSYVRYGTNSSNLNLVSSESALDTEHTVLVNGLSAATEYFYSIGSDLSPVIGPFLAREVNHVRLLVATLNYVDRNVSRAKSWTSWQ